MSSSGSPRSRIDQFFPSRKRTPALPQDVKAERDPKAIVAVSPSAKGTLDGYLVKSVDAGSQGDRSTERAIPLKPDPPVKRNLTLEVDLGFGSAPKDGAGRSVLDNSIIAGTFGGVQGGLSAAVVESANSSSKILDVCNAVESDDGNSQLQKFATDFLSLYCSDLPCTASLTSEEILKGQKRNGSPSLLVVNDKACSKKHCIVHSRSLAEGGERETGQDSHENLGDKQVKTVTPHSIEIDENGGGTDIECDAKCASFTRLRRCNVTPNNGLNKVQRSALGSFGDIIGAHQTPKSAHKSFMTSPGDEFWDEAIQVADVLIPTDKLSVQLANDFSAKNKKNPDSCFIGRQRSSIESLMDELACDLGLQSDKKLSNSSNNDCIDDGGEWGGNCSRELENYAEETKLTAAHPTNKASPLPVKHFDFLNEEHNLQENTLSRSFVTSASDIPSVQNWKSHLDINMNDLQSSGTVACNEGSMNNLGAPKRTDVCNLKVACMAPIDSSKLVEVSNACSTISLGYCIKNQGDKSNISHADMKAQLLNKGISSSKKEIGTNPVSHINSFEASTPSSSIPLKERLNLHNWLPPEICSIYTQKGISSLYSWQVDCLQIDGVLERRNLVYCASTSSGKSFVAEILMLRRVISTRKMAILVLPYVSICAEKADHLEALLEPLGKHVRSFYGNQGGRCLPKDTSVAVCTIEKANSLVNNLLEEDRLSEVGIIIIDELHMVGDQHRGYLLELLLTKLRYASGEGSSSSISGDSSGSSSGKYHPSQSLQVVGMSATMPNLSAVADWLQAALYQTDFRPVPLEEHIKVGNNIFNKKLDIVRTIGKTADLGGKDPDHIVELCDEIVQEGHSVLIFCSSRKGCESTARHISKFLRKFSTTTPEIDCELSDTLSVIEALRRCPAGLDPCLEETLPSGVAYHHAGLTVEEREIVETCYRKGLIRVLTATSTLAAGVNLPARRVIFRQPRIGRDFIDGTRYRQMAGRAGRAGIDTKGESILLCKPEEVKRITSLLNDSCPPLQSCLSDDKNGMIHAILEVVSGGIVQTATDIHRYVRCTLLNSTKPFQDVVKSAQDSLRWLCHRKFLEWNEETRLYNTTPLGRASFGSSLSPEESLVVLDDLSRAREGFVLASDLHLVYLVTPINIEMEPDWELYYERFMELSTLDQSVGNRVGVTEPFLMRMAHGAPMNSSDRIRGMGKQQGKMQPMSATVVNNCPSEHVLRVSKRFYVALMLSKLVQEVPIADVCCSFKVARGMIQSLQENAGRFASMVAVFCERLGWHDLEGLISKFQNRVSFGVRAEIVELTMIPYVKGSRARALYKFGLRTPLAIAEASTTDIAKALYESFSWDAQEDSAMRRLQLGVAKKIKNSARKIVLDKAEEARVVAFSAFQTLGIEVPQFSVTHLHDNIGASTMQVEAARPRTPGGISCSRKEELQISARDSAEQVRAANTSTMAMEGKLARVSEILDNAAPKLSLFGVYENSPSSSNTDTLAEAPSPHIVSLGRSDENDLKQLHDGSQKYEKVEIDRGSISIINNGLILDRGPINAGSISGGFDAFMDQWEAVQEFYFDIHFSKKTTSSSSVLYEVYGLAICWQDSPIYYINLSKYLISSSKPNSLEESSKVTEIKSVSRNVLWELAGQRWNRIIKIMGKKGVRKITWNLKSQIHVLKYPGISIQRFGQFCRDDKVNNGFSLIGNALLLLPVSVNDGIDICLVAWMLWPDEESCSCPNLDKIVKQRLSTEAAAAAIRDGRWINQMQRAAHNGCCRRVSQTRALDHVLWRLLISENLVEPFIKIESPMVKVLYEMESWGIGVDLEACLHARQILGKKLKELEKEAFRLVGMSFSLYSTADIANILYTHLKLPVPEVSSKKGKLHPSTDKHSLDLLRGQHPIVAVIKEHRTLSKLLNCTLGSICSKSQLCLNSQRYIIKGHWLQTSTATGRLSMEEPNLQCVEHTIQFTTLAKDCANVSDHHQINARDFFIPTQESWVLLTADYSQIELRLMAHFSGDTSLVEILSKPDGDVFTMLAAKWNGKQECKINSQERENTKKLVYGILYGMGANTLAEHLACSQEEAGQKIRSFKASFPGVSAWLQDAATFCCDKGYIETLMGRKRFLSKIKCGDNKEKSKAQRQAVNSICQGSAADIIKIAMINIHSIIIEGCELPAIAEIGIQCTRLKGSCRFLLQVHDELLLEVDPSLVREAALLLQVCMESAASLSVPLPVKLKIGKTWGSLQPFDPKY